MIHLCVDDVAGGDQQVGLQALQFCQHRCQGFPAMEQAEMQIRYLGNTQSLTPGWQFLRIQFYLFDAQIGCLIHSVQTGREGCQEHQRGSGGSMQGRQG